MKEKSKYIWKKMASTKMLKTILSIKLLTFSYKIEKCQFQWLMIEMLY